MKKQSEKSKFMGLAIEELARVLQNLTLVKEKKK